MARLPHLQNGMDTKDHHVASHISDEIVGEELSMQCKNEIE